MKAAFVLCGVFLLASSSLRAALQSVTVVERGPHSQIIQTVTAEGEALRTNHYTQLGSGLNVFRDGSWLPAEAGFEVVNNVAVAGQLRFEPSLGPNANVADAVTLMLPDGQVLRSQVIALQYWDATSGETASLGFIQDAQGELVSETQVAYANVLDGLSASLVYEIGLDHLEQNLVLLERPPEPQVLNPAINPASVRLELWTEFFDGPQPAITRREVRPGVTDDFVDYGSMAMAAGRALVVNREGAAPIYKRWLEIEGRTFLVEYAEYERIKPLLDTLPEAGAALRPEPGSRRGDEADKLSAVHPNHPPPHVGGHVLPRAAGKVPGARLSKPQQLAIARSSSAFQMLPRAIPQAPARQARSAIHSFKVADLAAARSRSALDRGVILDYSILLTQTNVVLAGDTTYFITSSVNLSGTNNVLEGGAVLKCTNSTSAKINVLGALQCRTESYRPAIFTSFSDDTVGEVIASSTGTPSNYGGALVFENSPVALHDARLAWASSAVELNFDSGQIHLTNLHFVHCQYPINASSRSENTFVVDNSLFHDSDDVFKGGDDPVVHGQHLTVDRCDRFGDMTGGGSGVLYLTNSLLVAVTNGWGDWDSGTTNSTAYFTSDPGGIFQTVGACSHYLAASSSYRNTGNSSISANLLADLARKTTYPPLTLTNLISTDAILTPQIWRDTDTPDLGAHFDPIDWVASGTILTNATLLLTNGVVLGTYGANSTYGILIKSGGKLVSESSPTNLNRIVRYNTVQPQDNSNWTNSTVAPSLKVDATASPQVNCRFTAWSMPGDEGEHFNAGYITTTAPVFRDCQFSGGEFTIHPASVGLTNCLFERVAVRLDDQSDSTTWYLYNNLFRGGSLYYQMHGEDPVALAYDNLFDQTTITQGGGSEDFTHGYNGYVTNANRLTPDPGTDQVLTNTPTYQAGPLGNFYYPANDGMLSTLVDAGSRNATNAGLYHYTTTTNKEGTTAVNIGFHYAALTNGILWDVDNDGLPDQFEDRNGNGIYDGTTDLSDWQDADTDDDGLGDLQEWELSNNVQVNDPAQDYGTDQNTQDETSLIAFDNTVIAAWVDSNLGVAGYGIWDEGCYDTCPPQTNLIQFIGLAISRDGGVTFNDMGALPLLSNQWVFVKTNINGNGCFTTTHLGNAGDPVLARDNSAGTIYMAGNPRRPSVYYPDGTNAAAKHYVPLWRSTNDGQTFVEPINAAPELAASAASEFGDKPWIAVDNFAGTGQGNVYLSFVEQVTGVGYIYRSAPGGLTWEKSTNYSGFGASYIAVVPNHDVCIAWLTRISGTNHLVLTKSTDGGVTFSNYPNPIVTLRETDFQLHLTRSNSSLEEFRAPILPALTVNPAQTSHLYFVYHDKPTNLNDKTDIFIVGSTNGGVNWDGPYRVNSDSTTNDQWQPVITVKPDGTKLFVAWYDRRNDPNLNSLIQAYGAFATLPLSTNSFATNFLISTAQFPPVFTGTNQVAGAYDTAYPPEFEPLDSQCCGSHGGRYSPHMGDYDSAVSDNNYVHYTWSDKRNTSSNHGIIRNQADIRFIRVSWPP